MELKDFEARGENKNFTPTLIYYLQPQRGWAAGKILKWNSVAVQSILDRYLLGELLLCGRLIRQSQSITSRALFYW
jgi:hypothetical protein